MLRNVHILEVRLVQYYLRAMRLCLFFIIRHLDIYIAAYILNFFFF